MAYPGEYPVISGALADKNSISTFDGNCHTVTFEDNHFGRYFDGVTVAQPGIHDITFVRNRVDFMGDDLAQFNGATYQLHIGWNVVNGPGMGWDGNPAVAGREDEIFFHTAGASRASTATRPARRPGSAIGATGAKDLSGTGYPGATAATYRGAVDPPLRRQRAWALWGPQVAAIGP